MHSCGLAQAAKQWQPTSEHVAWQASASHTPPHTQCAGVQAQQSAQIAHVIQLEQWMMEGAYNKVLDAVSSPADEYSKTYLAQLQDTVRCALWVP